MPASPSEVAHAWFARVWNAGDEAAIDELFVPHTIAHGLGAEPMRGPEAFKPFFHSFRSALPDIKVTVTHTVTEGNMCMTHCDVEGTHTGDSLGFPATNRKVKFSGFTLTRVEDGRIVDLAPELHDFVDTAAAVKALDLVITVDTAVAHLAGALGKPTWVLLPVGGARLWYWFRDRDDSPWYPRVHLKRRVREQSWTDLVAATVPEIEAALARR